jgi:short subunit dehydrogenase-like uncharacterized protein
VHAVTIVLYGATGYTGRLVRDELVRRGLDHVLSGRDPDKLASLGGARVQAARLDDDHALRQLLDGARVVINCAGPFTLAGDALVRAAIWTGTHYLDSTGEQTFIQMVFERHGEAAQRAGVALLPSLGFDYAPGDCLARLVAAGLEPLDELVLAYSVEDFGMTRGTLRSGLEMMKGGDLVYEDERWRPAPGGIFKASFDFPPPIGRQRMSRYPSGEVITVPRHTRTREVTSLLTTATAAPLDAAAPVMPYALPALGLALRTPLRGVLNRVIGLLPEGPKLDDRRAARFTIVARARAGDSSRQGVLRGSDVYGLTAVTLSHAAELLSAPGFSGSGALGAAAAFDPAAFLNHLGDFGLSWELEAPT